MPNFLKTASGISIAYEKLTGQSPGVIFCSGFMSDMQSTKAVAIEKFCRDLGHSYIRFDYRGRGQSAGEFVDGTIGGWLEDTLAIIDQVVDGPQVLIGSSMGGWIALLAALARKEKIHALIGIAPAPDFTEDLVWEKFTPAHKAQLLNEGIVKEPSPYGEPYIITKQLIEEARNHFLLDKSIALDIPVRILQGMQDEEVPWQRTLKLVEKIATKDVRTILIKDGDHRLTRERDLALLKQILKNCCLGNDI